MRRVAGESIEEMRSLGREYPDNVSINWPPRGHACLKSRSLPMMWVDADRLDILEQIESTMVSDDYIRVLTWFIRQEFWEKHGVFSDEGRSFFELNVRGATIQLLRSGTWVDEPETLGLQKLNQRLEKIDLGRRSDLNFSSTQSEIMKYDQDQRIDKAESAKGVDFEAQYRDGTPEARKEILASRPWMESMLVDRYGKP